MDNQKPISLDELRRLNKRDRLAHRYLVYARKLNSIIGSMPNHNDPLYIQVEQCMKNCWGEIYKMGVNPNEAIRLSQKKTFNRRVNLRIKKMRKGEFLV
jgi:hypothetical protein